MVVLVSVVLVLVVVPLVLVPVLVSVPVPVPPSMSSATFPRLFIAFLPIFVDFQVFVGTQRRTWRESQKLASSPGGSPRVREDPLGSGRVSGEGLEGV